MYFSDRETGAPTRTSEEIPENVWRALIAEIQARVDDGSFGYSYPKECGDGGAITGCDWQSLGDAIVGEIPSMPWPLDRAYVPPKLAILDLVEFCYKRIAKALFAWAHPFYRHNHLRFEVDAGRKDFRQKVNVLFARNGIAFELDENGSIIRLAAGGIRETLERAVFRTGDSILDSLLVSARMKYLDPDPAVRKEALEKLWDAWERTKTLEPGDKRTSTSALLDKAASESTYRQTLETEARELTRIGNDFQIRHTETGKVPLSDNEQVDYLFHRLFAMIVLLLRKSGRM